MTHYKIVKRIPSYLSGEYVPSQKLGKSYMALKLRPDGEWEEFGRKYTIKGITDFVNSYSVDTNLNVSKEIYLDIAFERWRRSSRKRQKSF